MQAEAKLTSPRRSSQPFHKSVDDYYRQKEKYESLAAEQKDEVEPETQQDDTLKHQSDELRKAWPEALRTQFEQIRQEQNKTKNLAIMPVHPAEENTTGSTSQSPHSLLAVRSVPSRLHLSSNPSWYSKQPRSLTRNRPHRHGCQRVQRQHCLHASQS